MLAITPNEKLVGYKKHNRVGKTQESRVKTRTQKTLEQMADSEVLAMALDDMEFFGLIKWKPQSDKNPAIDENRVRHLASDRQAAA